MSKNSGNGKFKNIFRKSELENDVIPEINIEEEEEKSFDYVEKEDAEPINLPNDKEDSFDLSVQDRLSMDLMSSVEQVLHNRQLLITKNKDLEEQVQNNLNYISRLRSEQEQKDKKITNLENTIKSNEERLINKQMNYDQLLEDYEDFQSSTKNQMENLKGEIAKEQDKYARLDQEFHTYQHESLRVKRDFEEKVRNLEVENETLMKRYEAAVKEKNNLLQMINDFTSRMTDTSSLTESESNKMKTNTIKKSVPDLEEY